MELDNFMGIPAHPLFVHLPIVLIPLLTLVVIVMAFKPDWREKYALATAIMAVVTAIATFLAAGAGESLEKRVEPSKLIEDHAELGDQTKILALVFALLLVGLVVAIRKNLAKFIVPLVMLSAVAGIVSTVWVARTGHAGAKSAWEDTPAKAPGGGGDADE